MKNGLVLYFDRNWRKSPDSKWRFSPDANTALQKIGQMGKNGDLGASLAKGGISRNKGGQADGSVRFGAYQHSTPIPPQPTGVSAQSTLNNPSVSMGNPLGEKPSGPSINDSFKTNAAQDAKTASKTTSTTTQKTTKKDTTKTTTEDL